MFKLNGVHVKHCKNTADVSPCRIGIPKKVVIPMSMHIGAPASPIVKVGDLVEVGTKIADAVGAVSSPIHASVSGKVTKISDILLSSGKSVAAITIESDGNMTPCESLVPPSINNREDLIQAIKDSGVVGLGGAGFPTYVKWNVESSRIE